MAFFIDEDRKFIVYESPKTGGTTLRSWINYAATGQLMVSGTEEYYHESPHVYSLLDDYGYDYSEFKSFEGYETVCIKRDPVNRFISCYTDKILRECQIQNCDLDNFINNFDKILEEHPFMHPSLKGKSIGFLWYHFVPQTYHIGREKDYYDYVIDTKEITTKLKPFLEKKWQIELPNIHTRKQNIQKISLSEKQVEKVKAIYVSDYETGWF